MIAMIKLKFFFITTAAALLMFSCTEPEQVEDVPQLTDEQIKASINDLNNTIVDVQEMEIEGYLHRKKYDMVRTGTGLRYMVYEQGAGDSIQNQQTVDVRYELRLLNEEVCYSNKDSGDVESFIVNMDYVESGLHEAMQYLHVGDKARVLMHSGLAHGLLGDRDCVPPSSPVLFDLEIIAAR